MAPEVSTGQSLRFIQEEVAKAASEKVEPGNEREVLILVDLQRDFFAGPMKAHGAGKIVEPLKAVIRTARSRGMVIAFTKDWHPADHWSFKENGGPWMTHCVMGTEGAELVSEVEKPQTSVIFEFGVEPGTLGYSPLENAALDLVVSNPRVQTVYVAGVALEYCVQATCLGLLDRGKRTVALESAIAATTEDGERIEKVWGTLVGRGVIRQKSLR